jgi:predicted AAA+ superfamily ATPase
VIFDEIQHAPDLLPYIKEAIDADRRRNGQFLLTGSQALGMHQGVTESLAGRVAMLHLLPFTNRERAGQPSVPLAVLGATRARPRRTRQDVWQSFLRGGYPDPALHPKRDASLWHASYVQTYLERDVRALRQVGDLGEFQRFLRALAARSAQLLNLTDLSRELGIAVNTAKAWLSVLEASYQVFVLRPFHANLTKRLVKTPKVYFLDVGTLCYLVGLRTGEHARQGPMAGAIFETAVVSEVVKSIWHQAREPRVYFWRTATGHEVDLLIETERSLIPVEAKATSTVRPEMAASIRTLRQTLGARVGKGFVVFAGDASVPLGPGAEALPFTDL